MQNRCNKKKCLLRTFFIRLNTTQLSHYSECECLSGHIEMKSETWKKCLWWSWNALYVLVFGRDNADKITAASQVVICSFSPEWYNELCTLHRIAYRQHNDLLSPEEVEVRIEWEEHVFFSAVQHTIKVHA